MKAFLDSNAYRTYPYFDGHTWGVLTSTLDRIWNRTGDRINDLLPTTGVLFHPGTLVVAFAESPVQHLLKAVTARRATRLEWFVNELAKLPQGHKARLFTRGASYTIELLEPGRGVFLQEESVFVGAWVQRDTLGAKPTLVHSLKSFAQSDEFGNVALLKTGRAHVVLHLDALTQIHVSSEDLFFDFWDLRALYAREWPASGAPWEECRRLKDERLVVEVLEDGSAHVLTGTGLEIFTNAPRTPRPVAALVAVPVAVPDVGRVFMWLQPSTLLTDESAWQLAQQLRAKLARVRTLTLNQPGRLTLMPCVSCETEVVNVASEGKIEGKFEGKTVAELKQYVLDGDFCRVQWAPATGEFRFDVDELAVDGLQYLVQRARCDDTESLLFQIKGSELSQIGAPNRDADWLVVLSRCRTTFLRLSPNVHLQRAEQLIANVRNNFAALVPSRGRTTLDLRWSGSRELHTRVTHSASAASFFGWLLEQPRRLETELCPARVVLDVPPMPEVPRRELVSQVKSALQRSDPLLVRVALAQDGLRTLRVFGDGHVEGFWRSKEQLCDWLQLHAREVLYVRVGPEAIGLAELRPPSALVFTTRWTTLDEAGRPQIHYATKNLVRTGAVVVEWTSLQNWLRSRPEVKQLVLQEDVYDVETTKFLSNARPFVARAEEQEAELLRDFQARLDVEIPAGALYVVREGPLQTTAPTTAFLAVAGDEPVYVNPASFTIAKTFGRLTADELLHFRLLRARLEALFSQPQIVPRAAETGETDLQARIFLLTQLRTRDDKGARGDFESLCPPEPPTAAELKQRTEEQKRREVEKARNAALRAERNEREERITEVKARNEQRKREERLNPPA